MSFLRNVASFLRDVTSFLRDVTSFVGAIAFPNVTPHRPCFQAFHLKWRQELMAIRS